MRTIILKEPDERFGLKAGKKYRAKPYSFDPASKMIITIGGKEICTQYRRNIVFCNSFNMAKKTHGGKRKGAGRPKKEKTKPMRIPLSKVAAVKELIKS